MRGALGAGLLIWLLAAPAAAEPSWQAAYEFALAQALAQEGDFDAALERFAEVVRLAPDEAFVRIEYGELLLRMRRFPEAAEQAGEALRLAPEDPAVLRLYGQTQVRLAEQQPEALDRAREAFERLRRLDPEAVEPLVTLGQIYLSQGRHGEAADLFGELLDGRPGDRLLLSFLVDALQRADRPAEAEGRLERFVRRDPRFRKAWMSLSGLRSQRGDHAAAAEALEAALDAGHRDVEVRRQLAVEQFRAGRAADALAQVDMVLAERPDDFGALYLRALGLADLRRDDEALALLAELRRDRQDSLDLALLAARLLRRAGRDGEAEAMLEETSERLRAADRPREAAEARLEIARLRADAGDWPGVLELTTGEGGEDAVQVSLALLRAEALARSERHDEALRLLEAITGEAEEASRLRAKQAEILLRMERGEEARSRLAPLMASADPEAMLLVADVYQNAGLFGEAIDPLERALDSHPDSREILFRLAASYERDGRHDEAETRFKRLLSLDPDFAPALNYLGYMWAERGVNLAEALDLVQRAVELEPNNGAYIDSLGWAYFQLGRLPEAQSHLERAASLVPEDAVVLEHLGDLYRAVGRLDEARANYQRALDLGGDNGDDLRRKLDELAASD